MSNKHTFKSTQRTQAKSDSFIIKSHSFNSVLSNKKYYNVVLTGFSQTTSVFTKFIQNNTIRVNDIKLFISTSGSFISISTMTSGSSFLSSVDSLTTSIDSHNRILFVPREHKDMGQAVVRNDARIFVRDSEKLIFFGQKIIMPEFDLTADANAHHYFYVSEWDSYLMSDLDAMTLTSMDYEVV